MKVSLLIGTLVTAPALWTATWLVPGVGSIHGWWSFVGVALVFGLVNAVVGRTTMRRMMSLILVPLAVGFLVLNTVMLWLTSALANELGLRFSVRGFWAAVWGGFVMSVLIVGGWMIAEHGRRSLRSALIECLALLGAGWRL